MRALSLSFVLFVAGCSGGGAPSDAGTAGGSATAGGAGTAGGSSSAGGAGTAGGASTAGGSGTGGGTGTGSCGWERRLTSILNDNGYDVLALPDQSVVVVGIAGFAIPDAGLSAGGFAVRFDVQGNVMWSRSYGAGLTVNRVEAAANGDLLLAGIAKSDGGCTNHHGADDVWVARVNAADGQEQFSTCIGGNDDEAPYDLREVTLPSGPALHLTGETDSHSNGDIGPKHGGGGFNAPDVLSAFVSYPGGVRTVTASCHGTNGPDTGRGFLDNGDIVGNTIGGNDGDLLDSGVPPQFNDLLITRFRAPPCTAQTCVVDSVRIGGEANDAVMAALPGNLVVGVTRSSDGGVKCPGASQITAQPFVAYIDGGIDDLVCMTNTGSATVTDAFLADGQVWVAGWGMRSNGFFSDAGVVGSGATSDSFVIAVDAANRRVVRRVLNVRGDNVNGAALRPDGCLVVVGQAGSDVRVLTIAP